MSRILLKLSGEALGSKDNIYDPKTIKKITEQINIVKSKNPKIEIAIVIGGGNIWRGKLAKNLKIDEACADYMGMLATTINGITLRESFKNAQIDAEIFNAFKINTIGQEYKSSKVRKFLSKKSVAILTGGTGKPHFTTDTCSMLRAIQLKCDLVLMAKNGVDGVYTDDPRINKSAKHLANMKYQEIIDKKLKVMDITAAKMAKDNHLKTIVFNLNSPRFLENILSNKLKHTKID